MTRAQGLAREWREMRARNYAEEGIAMIVGVETVGAAPPRAGEPAFADAFRAVRADLARNGIGNADPAAILELLAARQLRQPE